MTKPIIVVGSLNMDLIVRAARFPAPGETLLGGVFHTAPGGKGANQAVAAARLGGAVHMIGRVGNDGYGNELRATLSGDGVDVLHVVTDPSAETGVALITVDDRGQNSIIVASGANMQLEPDDVEAARTEIAGAAILLLQLEVPLAASQRAMAIARAAGVPVVLNPAPARPLGADLIAGVDYLIPNESEAGLLSGIAVENMESAAAAARALRTRGARAVIVTMGSQGALLLAGEPPLLVPPSAVTAVDTTAAGDAFIGGFAVALTEGRALTDAVRFANGVGALTVTKLGAQPSLPRRADVDGLLRV